MEINKVQLIYFIIILGLIYLLYNKVNYKEKIEVQPLENPDLKSIENNIKLEQQNESWKNQQFFFNPSNEMTNQRIELDTLIHSYLRF